MTIEESIEKDILLHALYGLTRALNEDIRELIEFSYGRHQKWITESIDETVDLREDITRLIQKIDFWKGEFQEVER